MPPPEEQARRSLALPNDPGGRGYAGPALESTTILLRRFEFRRDDIPIHDIPPRADVVGAAVLIYEIVGMLPHIEADDGLAFKTGDRAMLLWSVLMSPQTRSYDQAAAVLEELLAMPGHEELAAHYRYATTSLLPGTAPA